jgi:hypothetical protein
MDSINISGSFINIQTKRIYIISSLSGIIAALCWGIADFLLVGFGAPADISILENKGLVGGMYVPIVSLMVNNSTGKLLISTQLAFFTAPLSPICLPCFRYQGSIAARGLRVAGF